MPFCQHCGKEVSDDSIYCPSCGSQVRKGVDREWKAGTGLDLLMKDRRVQGHWLSRLVAYAIDSIVVGVATLIVGLLVTFPFIINVLLGGGLWTWRGFFGLPFSMGVVQIFYFTLMEGGYGASIGKQVMGLEVVDEDGKQPSFTRTLIRNLSKIYWALLLLDIFIGLVSRFDPRQRYTDGIAGTKVISLRGDRIGPQAVRPMPEVEVRSTPRPRREGDPLSGVTVGVTLIIIAAVFILHPGVFSEAIEWLKSWGVAGPTMIPEVLLRPVIWFLSAQGVWSLILAAGRVASGINRRNSISDAFGGVFLLTAAYLLREYSFGLMSLKILLPALVIALGASIFLTSATYYMLHDRLQPRV